MWPRPHTRKGPHTAFHPCLGPLETSSLFPHLPLDLGKAANNSSIPSCIGLLNVTYTLVLWAPRDVVVRPLPVPSPEGRVLALLGVAAKEGWGRQLG